MVLSQNMIRYCQLVSTLLSCTFCFPGELVCINGFNFLSVFIETDCEASPGHTDLHLVDIWAFDSAYAFAHFFRANLSPPG